MDFEANAKAVRGKAGVLKAQMNTVEFDMKKIKVYKDNKIMNIAKVSHNLRTLNCDCLVILIGSFQDPAKFSFVQDENDPTWLYFTINNTVNEDKGRYKLLLGDQKTEGGLVIVGQCLTTRVQKFRLSYKIFEEFLQRFARACKKLTR